ncbi:MAG TPA: sulfite exporter TauE/SafE family protein, partial [Candidatus Eisenbacteria bacterium]|nr:sulfite exporter TauE/SafE family protein [Candidatus Eisenbacteria bacterium]
MTIALGAFAGALGGMMGVGGGIILVPLLVHLLATTQHEAQATSLAFVVATALVAAVPYLASERLDLPLAAILVVGAIPGVMLGARLAKRTSAIQLRRLFGVALFLTAIRLLAAPPEPTAASQVFAWPWNVLLGFGVGFLAGLLGVGGGTVLVPVLVLGERIPQHTAQGISLLLIAPVGVVGALSYARGGHLATRALPGLLVGGVLGAVLGALAAHRIEAPVLSRLFAIL